jgi:hypothetical protein
VLRWSAEALTPSASRKLHTQRDNQHRQHWRPMIGVIAEREIELRGRTARPDAGAAAVPCGPRPWDLGLSGFRVRLHRRFRNRGTEALSESGMERLNGRTKRQCDRAL